MELYIINKKYVIRKTNYQKKIIMGECLHMQLLMCLNFLHRRFSLIKVLPGACLYICPLWKQIEFDRSSPDKGFSFPALPSCNIQGELQAPPGTIPCLAGDKRSLALVSRGKLGSNLGSVGSSIPARGKLGWP